MTTTQTFNRGDLQQTREGLERVRRDRLSDPGSVPGAFIEPGGSVVAMPGDLAPYSRAMPFPTVEQDYGRQEQSIGYVTPPTEPTNTVDNTLPLINVEDWRQITFTIRYTTVAPNGQLAITPLYGNSDEFPLPKYIPAATITVDGDYGYRLIYKEQFRTPLIPDDQSIEFKMTFDVSASRVFALSVQELNTQIDCSPESPCNVLSVRYSLSM